MNQAEIMQLKGWFCASDLTNKKTTKSLISRKLSQLWRYGLIELQERKVKAGVNGVRGVRYFKVKK